MSAPETEVRTRLIALLENEFAADNVDVRDDKIHDSLGQTAPVAGVFPTAGDEDPRTVITQRTTVMVQLFRQWDKEIDPEQTVSPAGIEDWAHRLRKAVQADGSFLGDEGLWFYRVTRIEYPPDPTGNITRLLATVQAWSQNAGVVETTG